MYIIQDKICFNLAYLIQGTSFPCIYSFLAFTMFYLQYKSLLLLAIFPNKKNSLEKNLIGQWIFPYLLTPCTSPNLFKEVEIIRKQKSLSRAAKILQNVLACYLGTFIIAEKRLLEPQNHSFLRSFLIKEPFLKVVSFYIAAVKYIKGKIV